MGGRSLQRDIDPSELRYLISYAERLWPEMRDVRWSHAWSGQLGDHVGPLCHVPREPDKIVLVCLGYNGRTWP